MTEEKYQMRYLFCMLTMILMLDYVYNYIGVQYAISTEMKFYLELNIWNSSKVQSLKQK